jgi:hypothetical protein
MRSAAGFQVVIQGDSWFLDWYEFLTCVNAIFLVQESHFSLDHAIGGLPYDGVVRGVDDRGQQIRGVRRLAASAAGHT